MTDLLRASALCADLSGKKVLNNAEMVVRPGQLLAVIGPNGAGKSSLFRAALRLLPIAHGQVEICGQDVTQKAPHELSRDVAYLPQGHVAHWPLDVETLVTLGRRQRHNAFERLGVEDELAVEDALKAVGLLEFRKRAVDTLSGGERARAFIARALAAHASIILADEPIAALDPKHQFHVMNIFKEMTEKTGVGIAVILHDLYLATRFCDAFILMNEGNSISIAKEDLLTRKQDVENAFGIALKHREGGVLQPDGLI